MRNIMPHKSRTSLGNPAGQILGGNNETGSHWAGGSYCAHMLLVAKSICTVNLINCYPMILLDHGGTD